MRHLPPSKPSPLSIQPSAEFERVMALRAPAENCVSLRYLSRLAYLVCDAFLWICPIQDAPRHFKEMLWNPKMKWLQFRHLIRMYEVVEDRIMLKTKSNNSRWSRPLCLVFWVILITALVAHFHTMCQAGLLNFCSGNAIIMSSHSRLQSQRDYETLLKISKSHFTHLPI